MLPYSSSAQSDGFYKSSLNKSNIREAESAIRILNSTENLLSDPKQTATALLAVKYGIFESTDQNLSYNLMALAKLLYEYPSAWNVVDQSLTDKIAQITTNINAPVNVLCPALSVLTLISLETRKQSNKPSFPSLELVVQSTENFVDALISRLLSSNTQVLQNVLQLINTLILTFALSKKNTACQLFEDFRDAGLLRNVAQIFENKPLAASCSPQLYDLQEIVRAVFHQNAEVHVDTAVSLHRKSLKQVEIMLTTLIGATQAGQIDWNRAGLSDGQDPVSEFNATLKWSGIQDFSDFLSQDDMLFKKMYLEHLAFAVPSSRFPLTQASLAVSAILYETFGIGQHTLNPEYFDSVPESLIPPQFVQHNAAGSSQDPYAFATQPQKTTSMLSPTNSSDFGPSRKMVPNNSNLSAATGSSTGNTTSSLNITSSTTNSSNGATNTGSSSVETELAKLGKLRPLFFEWSTLLSAGVINFLRLWLSSSAQVEDFDNIKEVVKILFRQAIPSNDFSTVSIDSVVTKLDTLSYTDIRAIQLRNIEEDLNNHWGYEIRSLHNQFHQESYDFVKEQRIRLLLRGEWFYVDNPTKQSSTVANRNSSGGTSSTAVAPNLRRYFVALSPSLNTLHYSEYPQRLDEFPSVDALSRTIDLSNISKVVVTSLSPNTQTSSSPAVRTDKNRLRVSLFSRTNYSRISLIFSGTRDSSTLTFYTDTPEKAAAWGDGLLMLKNKPYQSSETKKYIEMFAETKLRLQLLQVTPSDLDYSRKTKSSTVHDYDNVFPSDDYYYA